MLGSHVHLTILGFICGRNDVLYGVAHDVYSHICHVICDLVGIVSKGIPGGCEDSGLGRTR